MTVLRLQQSPPIYTERNYQFNLSLFCLKECVTITWKCWMSEEKAHSKADSNNRKHDIQALMQMEEKLFVSINICPWCLVFLFNLSFLLHLQFALSDLPAEWFFKWLFETLLIGKLITSCPSYCSFVSFLNEIPQPKLEMWLKHEIGL